MDWFATTPSTNYSEVMEALHLRAVVVDPYASIQDHFVSTSPDGHTVNWSHVELIMNASFGAPVTVGSYGVHPVPDAAPFLWAESNLTTIVTPTFSGYLSLLANVSATDPLGRTLDSALWTNSTGTSPDHLSVTPIVGAVTVAGLSPGGSARALLPNGTSVGVPGPDATAIGVTERAVATSGSPRAEVIADPAVGRLPRQQLLVRDGPGRRSFRSFRPARGQLHRPVRRGVWHPLADRGEPNPLAPLRDQLGDARPRRGRRHGPGAAIRQRHQRIRHARPGGVRSSGELLLRGAMPRSPSRTPRPPTT